MASLAPAARFAAPRQVVLSPAVPTTAAALLRCSPNPLHETLQCKGFLGKSSSEIEEGVEV
jgi:hypothetical protein